MPRLAHAAGGVDLTYFGGRSGRVVPASAFAPNLAGAAAIADFNTWRFALPVLPLDSIAAASDAQLRVKRTASFAEFFAFTAGAGRNHVDEAGQWQTGVAANQPRTDWRNGRQQLRLEGARTNKCTNHNANPTDLTNVVKAGDAAATLSVVDDSAALAAAGLAAICSSGKVYKLDNSAGAAAAQAQPQGTIATTTAHTVSAFVRVAAGSGGIKISGAAQAAENFSNAGYQRKHRAYASLDQAGRVCEIVAAAGAVVYFILNQVEDTPVPSDPIVTTGTAATRVVESARFSPLVEALVQRAAGTIVVRGQLTANLAGNPALIGFTGDRTLLQAGSGTVGQSWGGAAFLWLALSSGDWSAFGAAGAWSGSDRAICANGGAMGTAAAAVQDRSRAFLARRDVAEATREYGNGHYDLVAIFPSRLSNSEMQALAVAA